jgi:hypothetical protein
MLVEKRMKKGFFEPKERLDGGTSEKKGAVTCRLPAQLKDYALGLRSCLASAQTADNFGRSPMVHVTDSKTVANIIPQTHFEPDLRKGLSTFIPGDTEYCDCASDTLLSVQSPSYITPSPLVTLLA